MKAAIRSGTPHSESLRRDRKMPRSFSLVVDVNTTTLCSLTISPTVKPLSLSSLSEASLKSDKRISLATVFICSTSAPETF